MGNFECNSIQDLLFNTSFRKWVLDETEADNEFWRRWEAENSDKREMVQEAKAIIYALPANFYTLSDEQVTQEITTILQYSANGPFDMAETPQGPRKNTLFRSLSSKWYAIAAAVLILLTASWFLLYRSSRNSVDSYRQFIAGNRKSLTEQANNTGLTKLIQLEDGSRVYLENKSTLTWHTDFLGNREVYLDGEAFFEVAKNVSAPFVVYTRYMITKVLGTSFRVKAWPQDEKGFVAVMTGKVSVFKKDNFKKTGALPKELSGIVITPNQQVVYNNESNNFDKGIVGKPLPVEQPAVNEFNFQATPIAEVFQRLHSIYGVDIMYDEEVLAKCSLSAVLGKESFYDKLNLICIAIDATYEVIDGKIIINSKGCK